MLFSRILAKTGVGNHIDLLSDSLQRLGHNVIVVSGTQDIVLSNDNVKFIKIYTQLKNPIGVVKSIIKLHKIIKENNIDIVHCHHRVASVYIFLYNLVYKIPYVYTLHLANIPHDIVHRKFTFIGAKAIGVSTDVSNSLVDDLKISSEKVVTVLNGVDERALLPMQKNEVNMVKNEWNIPEDKIVIVMHSRIDPVKNHRLVVEAVNRLEECEKEKIQIVCSGEPKGSYYNEIIELIKRYNLQNYFSFIGWVNTRKILGIADYLFLPSFKEGFPLSVVEAAFMKVPVVRTKTAGYEDMKYGVPISATDPEDMVKVIRNIVNKNVLEYQNLTQAAYDFAKASLTATKMAENTLNVYKEVLNDNV